MEYPKYIKPGTNLFPNQQSNVQLLLKRRKALLTDRVGSGKSLSILYSFALLKERGKLSNMLVLTPLSALSKEVWKKDIIKFTNLTCIDVETLYKLSNHSIQRLLKLLSQYSIIYGKHTHVKTYTKFLQLICSLPTTLLTIDEIHALKNPKAEITLLTRQISSHSQSFWGITGSTISKSLEDFYNIINLIYPWYFGSFTQFRETYCTYREKVVGYYNGKRRKVLQITGIKDPVHFQNAISPLVISGQSFLSLHFHYLDYNLSQQEQTFYRNIARGIFTTDSPDWFQSILNSPELPVPHIKEVDLYSSRFLYLQSAADGILNSDGSQTNCQSSKLSLLLQTVQSIISKQQSIIIYFDYYASLNCAKQALQSLNLPATILESTGSHVLKDSDVTEAKCKLKPHIILGTKASSESVSLYFINNVIFFHIPTVPSTFVQTVGRITRKNTLFPDDLNVYIFRSNNIDLYKLLVVSSKAYQMELVQGQEDNIPPDYKQSMSKIELLDQAKKLLLWNN